MCGPQPEHCSKISSALSNTNKLLRVSNSVQSVTQIRWRKLIEETISYKPGIRVTHVPPPLPHFVTFSFSSLLLYVQDAASACENNKAMQEIQHIHICCQKYKMRHVHVKNNKASQSFLSHRRATAK